MALVAQTFKVGDGAAGSAGRWRLNSGSEMILCVDGINNGMPCRVVIDTVSAKGANAKIVALVEHDKNRPIGYWTNITVEAGVIEADLYLAEPTSETDRDALEDAIRIAALVRAGVPLQTSVGATAGDDGEWVIAAGSINCNGQDYEAENGSGMPLVILRGAELYEASIVTFGADDVTGKIAARKISNPVPNKDKSMDMKTILAKFPEKHKGLVATMLIEGADEAAVATKIHASEIEERDGKIAALTAEVADLKAKLDAKPAIDPKVAATAAGADKGVKHVEARKVDDKQDAAPTTLSAAMAKIAASTPDLKGLALRREAIRLYPDAQRV